MPSLRADLLRRLVAGCNDVLLSMTPGTVDFFEMGHSCAREIQARAHGLGRPDVTVTFTPPERR